MDQNSQELLKRAQKVLEDEGLYKENVDQSPSAVLKEFIMPGLKSSKDILSTIYTFQSRDREGFFGKIKTAIQRKIIFTVINVIEKQSMRQQKFNELTYRAIEQLIEENKDLKAQLEELRK